MPLDRRAALRSWSSFDRAGPATRVFLLARLSIIPLDAMDEELRSLRGRVLSVGCGHGLVERYLAEINPNVEVVGAELDADRVELVSASQYRYPRVVVEHGDARDLAGYGDFDAVMAVDVLHHVEYDEQAGVAAAMAGAIRPGGMCLVKDMDVRPAWKYHWNRTHDRIVAHQWVNCRTPEDMARLFERTGLVAERVERVDRSYGPYPQYVLRFRKPAA
ncbi:MAG: class I SAM-dependent methyltransferase [Acidimicrobiales bacterium]|nr:class I SAM-dependent methyltransferase [Acidimicrobiales bacterium]